MRGFPFAVIAALALAACSPESAPVRADVASVEEAQLGGVSEEAGTAAGPAEPHLGPQLAYEHGVRLVAPAKNVPVLLSSHQNACATAAANRCQIISTVSATERGEAVATLILRAEKQWLQQFRAGLAEELDRAGGRIVETGTTSEDLTRQIIDVEARLRAQRTLRDRLQALLASKPGKLAELLEVERELARVQGELDAATSTLQAYKTRVATELLSVRYESAPTAVGANAWGPLSDAVGDFGSVLARSLAALVTLIAAILPFALLLLPVAWLVRRTLLRKRAPQKSAS